MNFTPVPRYDYRIGVPDTGHYYEILNTDSSYYGGSNMGNWPRAAEPLPWMGFGKSILLDLPPLAAVFLKVNNEDPASTERVLPAYQNRRPG